MCMQWIKMVQEKSSTTLEQIPEAMKKYYDQRGTPQPDLEIADWEKLNAKNILTKRPTKKLTPRLYRPFKVLQKWGNMVF